MIVAYSALIEQDVKDILEPIVDRYLFLLPGWLKRIEISFMVPTIGGSESSAATTCTDKNYRWANVCINGTFLLSDAEERRKVIVHEFLHIALSNAIDYAIRTFEDLDSDNPICAHATRELNSIHEQGIQDIAYAIIENDLRRN